MISGLKEEANANLKPTHVDDEIEIETKETSECCIHWSC